MADAGELDRAAAYAVDAIDAAKKILSKSTNHPVLQFETPFLETSCEFRAMFTYENVSDLGWMALAQVRLRQGNLQAAIEVHSGQIDFWPESSCVHDDAVSNALWGRSLLRCVAGDYPGAKADLREALRLSPFDKESARREQRILKQNGYYSGEIDGLFGRESMNGYMNWIDAGCLGLPSADRVREWLNTAEPNKG